MSIFRKLWAFRKSDRGNVAVVFSLAVPMIAGGAGLGVETTYWYLSRLKLQSAADAAAFAAATEKRSGSSSAGVTAAAAGAASENGFAGASGSIEVNTPPTGGGGDERAVEVILHSRAERLFSKIFTSAPVELRARAVARYEDAGNACVLALNPTAGGAALFSGSSDLTLTSCTVMANSLSASAVTVQRSAKLQAECVVAVGGISATNNLRTACARNVTGAAPVGDPFRTLEAPTPSGACQSGGNGNGNNNGVNNLNPGYYCSGLALSGRVNLRPGVYYVGGNLKINAHADVSGEGVTIYMAGASKLDINGTATVTLSAPTSGPLSGMLFFGDRENTQKQTFNGDASSSMTGNIYFKSGEIDYLGNFSGANGCTHVVADRVQWSGSAAFSADCTAKGMADIPAFYLVKLAE